MKKIKVLILCVFMMMVTGCIDMDITIDLEKDGTGKMVLDVLAYTDIAGEPDISQFEGEFNEIHPLNENGKSGYRVIEYIEKEDVEQGEITGSEFVYVNEEKGLFSNEYTVDIMLKEAMYSELSTEDITMMSIIGRGFPVSIHIKSPIEFEESNAMSTKEVDGKTMYTWDYNLANIKDISIKYKSTNTINIFIGAVLLIGVVAGVINMVKKKKNTTGEEDFYKKDTDDEK